MRWGISNDLLPSDRRPDGSASWTPNPCLTHPGKPPPNERPSSARGVARSRRLPPCREVVRPSCYARRTTSRRTLLASSAALRRRLTGPADTVRARPGPLRPHTPGMGARPGRPLRRPTSPSFRRPRSTDSAHHRCRRRGSRSSVSSPASTSTLRPLPGASRHGKSPDPEGGRPRAGRWRPGHPRVAQPRKQCHA